MLNCFLIIDSEESNDINKCAFLYCKFFFCIWKLDLKLKSGRDIDLGTIIIK